MISDSQTWYGSGRCPEGARHGKIRRCRSYQTSSLACIVATGRVTGESARMSAKIAQPDVLCDTSAMSSEDNRQRGMKALAQPLARITRGALGRRGFAEGAVLTEWSSIVGPHLAAQTCPLKLSHPRGEGAAEQGAGPVLHIRVASGGMAMELAHLEPLVLQRINAHFGFRAVAKLALTQGPLPKRQPPRKKPVEPAPELVESIAGQLGTVENPELRHALARLGATLKAVPRR